jgi:hypothetical protein
MSKQAKKDNKWTRRTKRYAKANHKATQALATYEFALLVGVLPDSENILYARMVSANLAVAKLFDKYYT